MIMILNLQNIIIKPQDLQHAELKKGAVWVNYAENLEQVELGAEDCVKKIGEENLNIQFSII